jgi:hypothetical protein
VRAPAGRAGRRRRQRQHQRLEVGVGALLLRGGRRRGVARGADVVDGRKAARALQLVEREGGGGPPEEQARDHERRARLRDEQAGDAEQRGGPADEYRDAHQ